MKPAIPLREAMVCEECQQVVPIATTCPTCGSSSVWPLENVLNPEARMRIPAPFASEEAIHA